MIEPDDTALDAAALEFKEQMLRMYLATRTSSQEELADFLGIQPSDIILAEKRRIIADWLVILLCAKNIHPEWV